MYLKENKDGFTLIELILVVAIIGIIASFLFSPLITGFNFFQIDIKKINVQEDLRFTSNMIITYSKFANSVSLIDSAPGSYALGESCIILDNGEIKYINSGGERIWTESTITNLDFNIIQKGSGENVLEFSITGNNGGETFTINSQVLLNNISGQDEDVADYIGVLITSN